MTMLDMGRIAGVSPMTVSRALRNSALVNSASRDRIFDLARNRRFNRRHTIGVVIEMDRSSERPMIDQVRDASHD